MSIDVATIKKDFPLLAREIHGKPIVYLDSANTSQKPQSVLDAMTQYYEFSNANVHRGTYTIAEEATAAVEGARAKVARFIGAPSDRSVVFTKNATEALNLVVKAWARRHLRAGDPVVITELEHHANIVPWHQLVAEIGIELRWLPVGGDGHLDLTDLDRHLDGAKALSFSAMSNVLGTMTPVERLVSAAHEVGAVAIVDASQHVPHVATDVAAWGADFVAFTGHKMLGPTGIGVLYGTEAILEATPPFLSGGEMILQVTKEGFTANELPWKFEAGTPMVAEAVGLGAAVDYLTALGMEAVREHEVALTAYTMRTLTERFGDDITIHGPAEPAARGGVFSFAFGDIHPHDLTQVFDEHAVCVRAGHHCAKPLMQVLGANATARASLYVYNDESDIDALGDAIAAAEAFFAVLNPLAVPGASMPGIEDLYREIILDHYRNPRNRGELESPPATRVEGHNPLCGDEIVVSLVLDGDVVSDIAISGQGCSISQSSASMMSSAVKGKTRAEIEALTRAFKAMMSIHEQTLDGEGEGLEESGDSGLDGVGATPAEVRLGDLEALRGVVKFPVRIKCATLSWNTLAQGVEQAAV